MSTSCIIALTNDKKDEIILLEQTHDGFYDTIEHLIHTAQANYCSDVEEFANYLVKHFDVRISIYNHKHPHNMFVYNVDKQELKIIEINSFEEKIASYLTVLN